MSGDPASLSNINDIVLPDGPTWWPLAPGWYGLIALLVLLTFWYVWRLWSGYHANRYRREALAELKRIEAGELDSGQLPELLKRTALHVFPRDQVASLSGKPWRDFLNRHCPAKPFTGEAGRLLEDLAYQPSNVEPLDLQPLIGAAGVWIRKHGGQPC